MARLILAAAAAAAAFAACAATFPEGGWKGARVEKGARAVRVADAAGRTLLNINNPLVEVAVHDDRISIDPRPAFKDGALEVVMSSHPLDLAATTGRTMTVRSRWRGRPTVKMKSYLEGRRFDKSHYYTSRMFFPGRAARTFDLVRTVPCNLAELHLRFDFSAAPPDTVDFFGAEYDAMERLPPYEPPAERPETLFRASFDGTADADSSSGAAKPSVARGISFAPGLNGMAAKFTEGSVLEYPLAGNARPDRGTVAMWIKTQWPDAGRGPDGKDRWRRMFEFLPVDSTLGSGWVTFWWWGDVLRGDQRDCGDENRTWSGLPYTNGWRHVAMAWNETGVNLYVDGKPQSGPGDWGSPLQRALDTPDPLPFARKKFTAFRIGGKGAQSFEGLVDEFTVISEALSPDGILALYRKTAPAPEAPDWPARFAGCENPFEKKSGEPLDLELVREIKAGDLAKEPRFNILGGHSMKTLGGTEYLELGPAEGDRFALGFEVDTSFPLYAIDVDYPDDALRTCDIIVQCADAPPGDYALQVGYASGGENANTGRILTHRLLYWTRRRNVALVMMTARKGAPGAVSAIRIHKVRDGRLPAAGVSSPQPVGGWNRCVGLYYEDPAIGLGFATESEGYAERDISKTIDAAAAYMKFTGQNMLVYPAAWYHGLIEHGGYNPRRHPPGVRKAWYAKFDSEGLFFMPSLNPNNMPVAEGLVTRRKYFDGSLHSSPVAIHDTGLPNPGKWHGSPPNFCFAHPETRRYLEGLVDTLIAEGAPHPSFKGIALHGTMHNMLTFGSPASGYNDYCIDAFEKAKGVKVPIDRKDPMRGREYARWLRANAWREWTDWRCETVAAFWNAMAAKLAAARPDLKLMMNVNAIPVDPEKDGLRADDPAFMDAVYREASIDPRLFASAENVILCRTLVPADGRFKNWRLPEKARLFEEERLSLPGNYSLWRGARFPWLNHHDRYWESAIGRRKDSLSCDWLKEATWRVSTINPSGVHAMRDIVRPMRFSDILGFSKGGFLVGTYGMEEPLRRFAAAFRALPAVVFEDVETSHPFVRVRAREFGGRRYFYLVNTGEKPVEYAFAMPAGAVELATGRRAEGGTVELGPYELRSFACAPSAGR